MFPVVRRSDRPLVSVVAAARPNFMKVGPVVRALSGTADVELVHTGQHYDARMSMTFFDELSIPRPDVNLGVGSGSHARQTAQVMVAYEELLTDHRPDAVVVVGDVNSTLACALAAVKLHIPVAHVEAGLRSRNWLMPEEVNRVLTDRLSQWLFTPTTDANENLADEGIGSDGVHFVGNVMIDTLLTNLERARERGRLRAAAFGHGDSQFGVLTLHRPANVDHRDVLIDLMGAVGRVSRLMPLVFPIHPRTVSRMKSDGIDLPKGIQATGPLGYLDFIGLVDRAAVVLTDSGGIQEETSVLGIPCLTLRDETERPITVEHGTNILVGTHPDRVVACAEQAMNQARKRTEIPLWDGQSGPRIAQALVNDLGS